MRKPIYAILLLFINFNKVLPGRLSFVDKQLYEGNKCRLKNGADGICTKASECESRRQQIRDGSLSPATDKCGFTNFEEISCCVMSDTNERSENSVKKLGKSAEDACEKYKKMWETINESLFRTAVFNGVSAKQGEFPHMAALGYPASEDEAKGGVKYICGGTLITENHVVTAAHCVNNADGFVPTEVKLGTINLDEIKSSTVQRIPISKVIKHPDHKRSMHYHDVAILELKYPVNLTTDVFPTCVMTNGGNFDKDIRFTVLGWGAISFAGETSTKLLKAVGLTSVGNSVCQESYKNALSKIPRGIDDGMICVNDPDTERKADTCPGDSGGPLQISQTTLPPLVGITSFGQACGTGTPAVYASVNKYLKWIEEQVWPNLI